MCIGRPNSNSRVELFLTWPRFRVQQSAFQLWRSWLTTPWVFGLASFLRCEIPLQITSSTWTKTDEKISLEIEFYPPEKPMTLISIFLDFTPYRVYKFLVQQKQRLCPIRYTPRIKINPWMIPIADVLSDIKASINAVHQLKYPVLRIVWFRNTRPV